jgi:RsiW-degrading membrane proteinase PrsW (M82 family)
MQQDLERVARNRYGSWISSLLLILALAGFVALAIYFAPKFVAGLTGWQLVAFGLMMALVPALLWLIFFYLQDRLSPEPKGNVFGVFVLQNWMYTTWWVQLLASILVIGFVQEFLVYASVRYSIYRSRDFDERVDGVIYAIAAGLGYATVLNFQYVMQHGGVDVGVGAMTVTINALAQAGFAGIIGYFLGQAKFETTPRYWLALGVALAAVLNGVFFFLEDQVTMRGLSFTPLNGVILAGVFAFVILAIVFFLIRRANAETMAIARMQAKPPSQAAG